MNSAKMNMYVAIFGILLCMLTIDARHFADRDSDDEQEEQYDHVRRAREHAASQMRHRRKSWQPNYGYEYPHPPMYYPDNRREYDNNQQELLPQILRLLDEISVYVKRPNYVTPPPPQPVYVPYAVPYPIPQYCNCPSATKEVESKPNITNRFPVMDDTNQNWGFADTNDEAEDDGNDGSRPISFVPIKPQKPGTRPQPNVEHGSSQAGGLSAGKAPKISQSQKPIAKLPSSCDVFALSCCNGSPEEQRKCFNNVGCGAVYANGNACSQDRLLDIIDAYSKAYSPVN